MDNEANSSRSLCDGYVRSVDVFLLSISGDVWKECASGKKSWMNEKWNYVTWICNSDGRRIDSFWSYFFMKSDRCCSRMIWNVIFMGRWQSGQLHQTVNLTPHGYVGSNPTLPKLSSCSSMDRTTAF